MQPLLLFVTLMSPLAVFFNSALNIDTSLVDDVALLIALFFLLVSGKFSRLTIAYIPIAAFSVTILFSALVNQTPATSILLQIRSYMLPMVLYFATCYFLASTRFHERFIKTFLSFSLLLSLVGLAEAATSMHFINKLNMFGEVSGDAFRIHSLIGHPADYGYYIIFAIAIALLKLQKNSGPQKTSRAALIVLISILFLNLTLTVSKGPVLVLAISALALSTLVSSRQRNKTIFYTFIFLTLSAVFALGAWQERIDKFISGEVMMVDEVTIDEAGRVGFYRQAATVIFDNPLLGVGPGQFGGWVATSYNSPAHEKYGINTFGISSIDVFYPHLIGELGLFGLLSYLSIFCTIIYKFSKRLKISTANKDSTASFYSTAAIWSTLIILLCGFHTMINETFPHMILYWIIIGVAETKTNNLEKISRPMSPQNP